MSFLSRLKEKLFKSSSKIDEGLNTIVDSEETILENLKKDDVLQTNKDQEVNPPDLISESQKEDSSDLGSGKKGSFLGVFRKNQTVAKRKIVYDKLLESLEELLISAPMGVSS